MSLKRITPSEINSTNAAQLLIAIDNGDLKALQTIVESWGFNSIESALRFAIAILTVSKDEKKIHVMQNGEDKSLVPADSLLKVKSSGSKTDPSAGA